MEALRPALVRGGPGRGVVRLAVAAALLGGLLCPPAPAPAAATSACAPVPDVVGRAPMAVWHPGAGVVVRAWTTRNRSGDPVQVTVAHGDLRRVRLAAATAPRSGSAQATTANTAAVPGAVAGVNGDYFTYDRRGKAVPAGAQVRGGVVHTLPAGPTRFVGVDASGAVRTGVVRASGTATLAVRGRPVRLAVAAVNPTRLPRTGVAVVTAYGAARRPAAAWEVVLRSGRVVWSGTRARFGAGGRHGAQASALAGRVTGRDVLLAGSPTATRLLRTLRPGARVRVTWAARDASGRKVSEAIGSGAAMLRGGHVVAACTGPGRRSRPRTLVAWNPATRGVWFVTADGGAATAASSTGLTYSQVAGIARRLGATEAVMVDGGGSTTLAVRLPGAGVRRVDAPAWTLQRPVPNGLVLVPRR